MRMMRAEMDPIYEGIILCQFPLHQFVGLVYQFNGKIAPCYTRLVRGYHRKAAILV
jgi:hypothetical protein